MRRGRGFSYLDPDGGRVDEATADRIRELAVPPAWQDVWICLDVQGHLQATGVDAAGRKQYLYHPRWRILRDRQKFVDMIDFAHALPKLRRHVRNDLEQSDEPDRARVLACAVRLLDLGLFRIGGEEYVETGGSYGLATLHREHVTVADGIVTFDYPAKSGVQRTHTVADEECLALLTLLRRRRSRDQALIAYREGRRWHPVHSDDITRYLKAHAGDQFSAKDFRTWNATVLAAIGVAAAGTDAPRGQQHGSRTGSRPQTTRADARARPRAAAVSGQRVIRRVVRDVSETLGNTPAVARSSYIDPRVFDRYLSGWTIDPKLVGAHPEDVLLTGSDRRRRTLELAVLDLLAEDGDSDRITIGDAG